MWPFRAAKKISSVRHAGRSPLLLGFLSRTKFDYAKEVGSGIDSSVVSAPVQWIQRAFPEARLRVVILRGAGREEIEDHPLVALIKRPNAFYGDIHLWAATLFSLLVAGNAYWLIVRNGAGRPSELWWAPHWAIAPKWPSDGSQFVSHYDYRPGGATLRLEPEDIVHFRHGIDPRNPRLGLSPINGAIREIFIDLESSNFVASLLRNMGVPGTVISPDGGIVAAQEDVDAVKAWFRDSFAGDKRGAPLVMGAATKVEQFGFNPQQMDLSIARDVAEERVCACLGIPAAVVGFGAGLQTAKVGATMNELRRLAWVNGVIPVLRMLADELQRSLLPAFATRRGNEEVDFDTGGVVALEEDALVRAQRWSASVAGGWAQVAEARQAFGLEATDADRIYLRSIAMIEVPAGSPLRMESRAKDRARRNLAANRYVIALERMERPLRSAFAKRLEPFFSALGRDAGEAGQRLLEARGKQGGDDEILVSELLAEIGITARVVDYRLLYQAHYLAVATEVAKAGEMIGLAASLPDPVARAVVAAGGRRAGLVDLDRQSREALFDALAEGRAAGEGAAQLAARIRDHVAAGPSGSAETRSLRIARTETKFAQNVSTVARAQHEGVQRFVVFDGRLGPGRSLPEHIARDGSIVSADEASAMAANEHPNGTLSFAPFFEETR